MKKTLLTLIFLSFLNAAGICQSWEKLNYNSFLIDGTSMISKDGQLFLASAGGIYKSEDNGEHWEYSSYGLNTPFTNVIYDIFSDETGIYCHTWRGVYKSSDNGVSWQESSEGLITWANVSYAKIFRLNGKLFLYEYLYDKYGKLYVSNDNAQHWSVALNDLSFKEICVEGSSIYGVDGGSIKKSSDGYLFSDYSFNSISSTIQGINVANGDLFAIASDQLYHSAYDSDWETLSIFPETERPVLIKYLNNQLILATSSLDAGNFFLYYSSDNGDSWQSFNKNGLEGQTIQGIFYLNEQYIALTDIGLYLLKEGSNAWIKATNGLNNTSASEFTVSGNVLVVRDNNGISISKDKGETWTKSLENKLMGGEYYIDELINTGKYLFAKASKTFYRSETLYKSENHGQSWSKVVIPYASSADGYFGFDVGEGDTLILYFRGMQGYGRYLSVDGGVNWNFVGSQSYRYLSLSNNVLFATTYSQIGRGEKLIKSVDLGQTWVPAWVGLDSTSNYINKIISGDRNTFYISSDVNDTTLYKSIDNGSSWTKINVNHSNDHFRVIDYKYYDNALYVSSAEGIAKSEDGGESWVEIRGDLPVEVSGTLEFMDDEVYCGSTTHGIWKGTTNPMAIHNKSNSANDLLIYPNPASDYTNVKLISSNGIIRILNMQGEVVKEMNTEAGNMITKVQTSDFRAGIYLVKYESEGKSFTARLVIVK